MCPSAEQLLGQLAGEARIIPIAYHVDYFNDPWVDPFSDAKFSRREMQYSVLYDRANKMDKPNYLYLTPLVMVDGRTPMVGKNDGATKARAADAIRRALAEKPGVSIGLTLPDDRDGAGGRTLEVSVAAVAPALRGREVLVVAVPYTARTSTKVASGELAGKTYSGRFVARGFEVQTATVPATGKAVATFRVTPPKGFDPKADGLVVIVQDDATGRVHQAATIPWGGAAPSAGTKAKTSR